MTFLIARTQINDCNNPIVWFMYQKPGTGFLEDIFSLSFEVYDVSQPALELNPALVIPLTNVPLDDCPAGGRLGKGRYVGTFTPGPGWNIGQHFVRWYYQVEDGGEVIETDQYFKVTDEQYGPNVGYVSVDDLLEAGLDLNDVPGGVARVRAIIKRVSRFIDQITKRHFCPEYKVFRKNGLGGPRLILREVIMSIEEVRLYPNQYWGNVSSINNNFYFLDDQEIFVFNRHLRQNLLQPDDRDNPVLDLSYWSRPQGAINKFPDGSQDVEVKGVFGYTDPDGSPLGKVPDMVEYVAKLLVGQWLPPELIDEEEGGGGGGGGNQQGIFITKERTRDQEVQYGGWGLQGGGNGNGGVGNQEAPYTGVVQIDRILQQLQLPCILMLGA